MRSLWGFFFGGRGGSIGFEFFTVLQHVFSWWTRTAL